MHSSTTTHSLYRFKLNANHWFVHSLIFCFCIVCKDVLFSVYTEYPTWEPTTWPFYQYYDPYEEYGKDSDFPTYVGFVQSGVSSSDPNANFLIATDESLYSFNGLVKLHMQTDGNLVLSDRVDTLSSSWNVLWETYTDGNAGAYLELRWDGNMNVVSSDGLSTLWSSGSFTNGLNAPNALHVVGAGYAYIETYDDSPGSVIWQSPNNPLTTSYCFHNLSHCSLQTLIYIQSLQRSQPWRQPREYRYPPQVC